MDVRRGHKGTSTKRRMVSNIMGQIVFVQDVVHANVCGYAIALVGMVTSRRRRRRVCGVGAL